MTIAEARPAATVVLLRQNEGALEVLLLLRNRSLGFHGGEWVFPGGRVDLADAGELPIDSEEAGRRAAARETLEEAGIAIDASAFVTLAHWTTPTVLPKRFATYFFVGEASGHDIVVDGGEIESFQWIAPAEAIRRRDAGELGLPPPTFVTLTELAAFERVADAIEAIRGRETPRWMPHVAIDGDAIVNLLPGDAGYEATQLDAPGPRHRVVMAPGRWRYERG